MNVCCGTEYLRDFCFHFYCTQIAYCTRLVSWGIARRCTFSPFSTVSNGNFWRLIGIEVLCGLRMWSIKLLPTARRERKLILYLAFDRIPIGICLFRIRCGCVLNFPCNFRCFWDLHFPQRDVFVDDCNPHKMPFDIIVTVGMAALAEWECEHDNNSSGALLMMTKTQFFGRNFETIIASSLSWMASSSSTAAIMRARAFASIRRLLHDNPEDI